MPRQTLTGGRLSPPLAPLAIDIEAAIPEQCRASLGSGTQARLAVAARRRRRSPAETCSLRRAAAWHRLFERGRAGPEIGIGAFETAGFLVDGGKAGGRCARRRIIARAVFPRSEFAASPS